MPQEQPAIAAAADLARRWPRWPTYGLVEDLLPAIERWATGNHRVVLATLVTIVGTSPRPLGSEMAICDTGEVVGYVSGGCVEGAVAAEALAVMADGKPRVLDYGAGSPILDVQLTCGGRIGIFVHELADPRDYVARLRAARTQRQALEVHIDLESGALRYYTLGAGEAAPPRVTDRSSVFVLPHLPPVRLLVAGGNPVALAVCQLAPHMGYAVDLLRPLGPAEPPPDLELARYDRRPVAQAMTDEDAKLDPWTAVYALTHHPEEDLVVLAHALRSPAFAIGVLGSRSKITERLRRLGEAGIDAAARARLHAPAGLELGARGPHEIALAILAQIVSLRPKPECQSATVIPMTLGASAPSLCEVGAVPLGAAAEQPSARVL